MLFNSLKFAIFLPIVYLVYWFASNKKIRIQNGLLLIASYFFYACWDYRFLFLLIFSTLLDYVTGLKIENVTSLGSKKKWFWLSIVVNLGFLGIFKYYNFFDTSFASFFNGIGLNLDVKLLNIVLPVGISFYTFHGLSYVIDIYKNRIKAESNFVDYSLFVSFFPLLVAGPIERATHLLPQIKQKRKFDYSKSVDGLRQILWGLFKKVVIADNCAEIVNVIFGNYSDYSSSTLIVGAVFFSFQIYGDFSGYSDIALGTARLFGIELLQNFKYPYFSRNIAEFWRRWHISLSSWFRDYLYIPLGGSKGTIWIKIRNTLIIFIVSGFWHGASWNFIVWGILNALFILPSIFFKTNRNYIEIVAKRSLLPSLKEFISVIATFCIITFAWIFFRANSCQIAINYIRCIFTKTFFIIPEFQGKTSVFTTLLFILFMIVIEWIGREDRFGLEKRTLPNNLLLRFTFYYFLTIMIFYFSGKDVQFIYFQF